MPPEMVRFWNSAAAASAAVLTISKTRKLEAPREWESTIVFVVPCPDDGQASWATPLALSWINRSLTLLG